VLNSLWTLVGVFRAATVQFSATGAAFLAQAIAFNIFFAAIPLSLVIVAMFGYIFGTEAGDLRALDTIDQIAPQFYDLVSENIQSVVRYRGVSGIVGLVGLIWSGKNVFGAVSYGLDRSLGLQSRHFLYEILIAVVLVPILGLVLIIATAGPLAITYVERFTGLEYLRYGPQIGSYSFSLAFVFVLAFLIYTYLPNRRAHLSFGLPGALVTAIGYSLAQVAFGIYTAHANVFQIYGTLSAIFALMLWVYYMCLIFLYGAHVSAQWEARHPELVEGQPEPSPLSGGPSTSSG
jgi:YihY family inner membrane protein